MKEREESKRMTEKSGAHVFSFSFQQQRRADAFSEVRWERIRGSRRTTKSRLSYLPRDNGNQIDCQMITAPQCDFSFTALALAKVSEYLISS